MADEFVDVLVVGAGIPGIGAGYHLQKLCPDHSYAIVEARKAYENTIRERDQRENDHTRFLPDDRKGKR